MAPLRRRSSAVRWGPRHGLPTVRGSPSIAPASRARRNRCEDIYIVNADGTGETLAIPNGGQPTWSPGGDQIAFTATGTEGYIYRANTDGSNRTLLYNWEDADIYGIGGPAWAPESPVIMFHEGTLESACNPDLEECADLYPGRLYTVVLGEVHSIPRRPRQSGRGAELVA